jgi:predicted DNA-binding mobile mystery protein A
MSRATPPRGGWVKAIREALGMSAADLAARMDVSESTVLALEKRERGSRVQLDTLVRAADALDCDVVYALVPRRSLDEQVDARAQELARATLHSVEHSMRLEQQPVGRQASDEQLADTARALRDSVGLWRDR